MILLTSASKDNFFDRPKVMQAVDEIESKAFNKIGGRIRVTAMRSQRSQKKPKKKAFVRTPSPPGQPPRRRVPMGSGLTKIYYTYNKAAHRVDIGPVKFGWSSYPNVTVPQLHEFGGTVRIVEVDFSVSKSGWQQPGGPHWVSVGPKSRTNFGARPVRTRSATYPARPFMRPALEKNKQFINDAWSGASASVT